MNIVGRNPQADISMSFACHFMSSPGISSPDKSRWHALRTSCRATFAIGCAGLYRACYAPKKPLGDGHSLETVADGEPKYIAGAMLIEDLIRMRVSFFQAVKHGNGVL